LTGGGALPKELEKFRVRLMGLVYLVRCCKNFMAFSVRAEDVRARAKRDGAGKIVPPVENNWGGHGDREERTALYALMRAELDNTQNLIDLIEGREEDVFVVGEREEDEDIFMLSPALVGQLRRKMEIMLEHWLDVDLVLRRPNL
jgi:hypothetical protein